MTKKPYRMFPGFSQIQGEAGKVFGNKGAKEIIITTS